MLGSRAFQGVAPVISGRSDRAERRMASRLRKGDPDALAEVHRTYGGMVLGYLRNALADAAAAEDVHQEVFLEVWRRGPGYDPDSHLLTRRRATPSPSPRPGPPAPSGAPASSASASG